MKHFVPLCLSTSFRLSSIKRIFSSLSATKTVRKKFILLIESIVFLQRGKVNSSDYHDLTNIMNNIGRNSLLQSNIPLQLHFLIVTYYLSSGFIFSMSTSFSLTSKSTTVIGLSDVAPMSCPSWQWHRTGYRWSPVRTLPVAPLWSDLGRCSQIVVVIKVRRFYAFNDSCYYGRV